jgi:hypothetical protein
MIHEIHRRASEITGTLSSLDGPSVGGYYWLDISLGPAAVTVLWRPEIGLGLYLPSDDIGMGCHPDEHYGYDVEAVWTRITGILCPKEAP